MVEFLKMEDTVQFTTIPRRNLTQPIPTSYAMLSSGIPWNIPRVACIFRIHTSLIKSLENLRKFSKELEISGNFRKHRKRFKPVFQEPLKRFIKILKNLWQSSEIFRKLPKLTKMVLKFSENLRECTEIFGKLRKQFESVFQMFLCFFFIFVFSFHFKKSCQKLRGGYRIFSLAVFSTSHPTPPLKEIGLSAPYLVVNYLPTVILSFLYFLPSTEYYGQHALCTSKPEQFVKVQFSGLPFRNNPQSRTINILLASFARSVRQAMGPRFCLPCFHGPRPSHLGHKRKGKKTRSITCRTDLALG